MKRVLLFAALSTMLGCTAVSAGELAEGSVYDDNGIVISYSSKAVEDGQTTIQMTYENNSGKNLSLMPRVVAVNGKVILWNYWGYGSVDVADGKKNIDEFTCGEESINSIDAEYSAFNDDYKVEFTTGVFRAGDEAEPENVGTEIYADDAMKIAYVGREGNTFEFCLTNTSDLFYGFDVENISVNDFTIDDYDNFKLRYIGSLPNCQTNFSISLEGDENSELLSNYGIDSIDQIGFSIDVLVNDSEFDDASYSTGTIDCNV